MYERLGYVVYRSVIKYYSGDPVEDAYDMRKSMPKDKEKITMKPLNKAVFPHELEFH